MNRLILTFIFFMASITLFAQELDCAVNVTSPKLEGTEKRVFETIKNAIFEFMNSRRWTNYNFKQEEKIECTVFISVNDRLGGDEYRGTMNLVLRRPVFNSVYNSVLLNYLEKGFQFRYTEFQPLDYSDGQFSSNLTSVLAFYTYFFLGLYYDSFSLSGGTPFFEKAQEVVNTAQNAQEAGWKAYESDKNRFWLVENYLNPGNTALREFSYKFHRLGLDQMYDKVDQGRGSITESLELLKKIYNARPGLFAMQLIFDAKRDEFVNIYADSRVPPMERSTVVNILKEIDPASSSKYQTILEAK